MNIENETIICSECKIEKNLSEFPKDNRTKKGYKNICLECYNKKYPNRNYRSSQNMDAETVLKKYLKINEPHIYKGIYIKSIAEDIGFLETLIKCIKIDDKYLEILKYQERA